MIDITANISEFFLLTTYRLDLDSKEPLTFDAVENLKY